MLELSTITAPRPLNQISIDQHTNTQEHSTTTTGTRKITCEAPNHEPSELKIHTNIPNTLLNPYPKI